MADQDMGKVAAKGGRARASVLLPSERSDIARGAANARWKQAKGHAYSPAPPPAEEEPQRQSRPDVPESAPVSFFRGTLHLGNIDLECHVLGDGNRVFTQREVVRALSGGRDSGNLKRYLESNPLIPRDLLAGATQRFKVPGNPTEAVGYEATLLVEICDRYLAARDQGMLKPNQLKLAVQADIIVRACAKVGIIALIDEATGYQKYRAENALRLKFQAFIAEELQEWAKMFPDEFWFELARLEGIRYSPRNRPLRWGRYVMMFVYDAIDGDVGRELRKKNPNPRFLKNHHQWLKQYGREKVHDQIQKVVTIMMLCETMEEFRLKFARVFKKSPLQMSFSDIDWHA